MNLRLELSICRICSEMMKLIRGFLAYFMWTRWMEEIGGDVGDSDGHVGGPPGPRGRSEDVRKPWENRQSVHFRICCRLFFCTEPSCTNGTEHWQTSLEARGKLSTVHSPHHLHHLLAGSLTVTTRCDRLPACEALS